MTKQVRKTRINVLASMRSLEKGESMVFPKKVNEQTMRCTATRVKNTTGGILEVNKQGDGSFKVTRIN